MCGLDQRHRKQTLLRLPSLWKHLLPGAPGGNNFSQHTAQCNPNSSCSLWQQTGWATPNFCLVSLFSFRCGQYSLYSQNITDEGARRGESEEHWMRQHLCAGRGKRPWVPGQPGLYSPGLHSKFQVWWGYTRKARKAWGLTVAYLTC